VHKGPPGVHCTGADKGPHLQHEPRSPPEILHYAACQEVAVVACGGHESPLEVLHIVLPLKVFVRVCRGIEVECPGQVLPRGVVRSITQPVRPQLAQPLQSLVQQDAVRWPLREELRECLADLGLVNVAAGSACCASKGCDGKVAT